MYAQSACNADAKTTEAAVEDYHTSFDQWPQATTSVVPTYLRSWPSNGSHYTITIDTLGNVYVNNGTTTANFDASPNPCNSVA